MTSKDPDETPVACPTCADGFETATGMKIHHAQAHDRSLDHSFRDEMELFERDHNGQQVLLTVYHDEAADSRTLHGTLRKDGLSLALATGVSAWEVMWLGGRDPSGYYVYPAEPEDNSTHEDDCLGRVVRLQLVETTWVEATDDGLKTTFEGRIDLSERINNRA